MDKKLVEDNADDEKLTSGTESGTVLVDAE